MASCIPKIIDRPIQLNAKLSHYRFLYMTYEYFTVLFLCVAHGPICLANKIIMFYIGLFRENIFCLKPQAMIFGM